MAEGENGELDIFLNSIQFNKFMLSSCHAPVLSVVVDGDRKKDRVQALQGLGSLYYLSHLLFLQLPEQELALVRQWFSARESPGKLKKKTKKKTPPDIWSPSPEIANLIGL